MFKQSNTDLRIIKLKDGRPYSIRRDRKRFFFPDEWIKFIKSLKKDNQKQLFNFMFNTGARITEALFIRVRDFERQNVRLWKTKTKAKKGEKEGSTRTISLNTEFHSKIKRYFRDKKPNEFIFKFTQQGANQLLKRKLKKIGIKDYYNFSTHNIRKTHGMYLKALGVDMGEICTRLGHDADTYIRHYGSADIFNDKDMRQIKELLGDLYMRKRKF